MPDLQNLLDQIQERAKAAGDHVAKLCTKEDRWKMSVPVQDTDSDVLLIQITDHDVPQLAKALRAVMEDCQSIENLVHKDHAYRTEFDYGMRAQARAVMEAITDVLKGADDD